MRPDLIDGNMRGLFQVSTAPDGVLDEYNEKHSPKVTAEQLFQPDINTIVFIWYLANIIVPAFKATGIPNLQVDWANPEFVRLVTAGWNSGPYGVVKVAKCVQAKGHVVTHANVFRFADECGGPKSLQSSAKQTWQVKVQQLYSWFRQNKPLPPISEKPPFFKEPTKLPTVTVQPRLFRDFGWMLLLLTIAFWPEIEKRL